jgi:hypothetical protein
MVAGRIRLYYLESRNERPHVREVSMLMKPSRPQLEAGKRRVVCRDWVLVQQLSLRVLTGPCGAASPQATLKWPPKCARLCIKYCVAYSKDLRTSKKLGKRPS